MTSMTNTTTTKERSYRNRVRRGQIVRFTAEHATGTFSHEDENGRWIYTDRLVPGETYEGTVFSESNAGFRGIEMSVKIDGRLYSGISTGTITKVIR